MEWSMASCSSQSPGQRGRGPWGPRRHGATRFSTTFHVIFTQRQKNSHKGQWFDRGLKLPQCYWKGREAWNTIHFLECVHPAMHGWMNLLTGKIALLHWRVKVNTAPFSLRHPHRKCCYELRWTVKLEKKTFKKFLIFFKKWTFFWKHNQFWKSEHYLKHKDFFKKRTVFHKWRGSMLTYAAMARQKM